MARPLRLEYEGAWYHVTSRGNERRNVFRGEADRSRFVMLLGELEARYGLEIHGYVLMPNHYHLFVRMVRETGLSAGMQWMAVSYTNWFNRRHRRSGHLFLGRFKAILVDFEEWGMELSRYIHLNPIRTRRYGLDKTDRLAQREGLGEKPTQEMVRQRLAALKQYPWSSYRAYLNPKQGPKWLHAGGVLGGFGKGSRGRQVYRQFVEEAIRFGLTESPWEKVKAGFVLGGEELLEKVRKGIQGNPREQSGLKRIQKAAKLEEMVKAVCQLKGEKWEEFVDRRGDWGRDMVLVAARKNTALTNKELADWLGGWDDSTVAQAVKRFHKKMETNPEIKRIYQKLEGIISNVKT